MIEPTTDENRQTCWNKAVHAYGTGWFFSERANAYRKRLQALSFLGLAVPVAVGGVLLAFGTNTNVEFTLFIAGIVSIAQFVIVLWSMAKNWQDVYTTAFNSAKKNNEIWQEWEAMAKNPPRDNDALVNKMQLLTAIDQMQANADLALDLTDADRSKMMRRGLIQYNRRCATCSKQPTSMKPTEHCVTCANF